MGIVVVGTPVVTACVLRESSIQKDTHTHTHTAEGGECERAIECIRGSCTEYTEARERECDRHWCLIVNRIHLTHTLWCAGEETSVISGYLVGDIYIHILSVCRASLFRERGPLCFTLSLSALLEQCSRNEQTHARTVPTNSKLIGPLDKYNRQTARAATDVNDE